jgi:hypothetical protein
MRIELPQSWEDITIKQFIEISSVQENYPDDIEQMIELLSVLSGVRREQLELLDIGSLRKAFDAIAFINNEQLPQVPKQRIKINGIDYFADFAIDNTLNAGDYISLKHFTKDPKAAINNIHNILAVVYKPVHKKNKDSLTHSQIAEDFLLSMKITEAYPVAVFFWTLSEELKNHLVRYSAKIISRKTLKILTERRKESQNLN